MKKHLLFFVCIMLAFFTFAPQITSAVSLDISNDKFTLNGTPTFLLGASYFDALGWRTSDFDTLATRKFNLIRIWLDWNTWVNRDRSLFYTDGSWHWQADTALLNLVRAANSRGFAVDVTIAHSCSAEPQFCGSAGDYMPDRTSVERAVRNTVSLLKDETNVFYDLINEHPTAGAFSDDHAWLSSLVSIARQEDSNAIITISEYGGHYPANVYNDLNMGIDLLAPHFERTSDWYNQTDARVAALKSLTSKPIYLQEEARRGQSGLYPSQEEFLQSAREARDSGAAGWVFHTSAGFDLATYDFFSQLDSVERATVDSLGSTVFDPSAYCGDTYCNNNETCSTCPTDCGACPPPILPGWTFCANENQQCSFTGAKEVQYGANGQYFSGTFTNGVLCANSVFGDPIVGVAKYCYYRSDTTPPAAPTGLAVE